MIFLSFEKFLKSDVGSPNFNKSRYIRTFKERPGISKVKLESDIGTFNIDTGSTYICSYEEKLGVRYIAAVGLIFDIVVSIYDIDNRNVAVARFLSFDDKIRRFFEEFLKKAGNNLEYRIVGLQNGQGYRLVDPVVKFAQIHSVHIFEIDLFGTEVRNVAIDVKTGMTSDVLMFDRLYKPGELVNMLTMEQFERNLKDRNSSKLSR